MKEHFMEGVKCTLTLEIWIRFILVECEEAGGLRKGHDCKKCAEDEDKKLFEKQIIHFFSYSSM